MLAFSWNRAILILTATNSENVPLFLLELASLNHQVFLNPSFITDVTESPYTVVRSSVAASKKLNFSVLF